MAFRDDVLIDNLLGRVGDPKKPSKFEKNELLYINDINQSNYANSIKFATKEWLDNLMAYPNGSVAIPIVAEGTGTLADFVAAGLVTADTNDPTLLKKFDPEKIGVTNKNGSYQWINSVILKINGVTIQNSQNMHLHNNIRALTKWSESYANTHGQLHNFAKDDESVNDGSNMGFVERVEMTNYDYEITQDVTNGPCKLVARFELRIALALMTDFFARLGIPLKNANVELSLGLNGIKKGSGEGQDWTGLAFNDNVKAALANGSQSMSYTVGGHDNTCKLWVPHVTLTPEDTIELASLLESEAGLERTIVWDDAQAAPNKAAYNLGSGGNLNNVIATSIRRPIQVYSMFFPKPLGQSVMKDQSLPYPAITAMGIKSNNVAPPVGSNRVGLKSANLRIDSQKLYQENIESPYDFYEILRNQCLSGVDDNQTGSLISFREFQDRYQIYCFDLTSTTYKISDNPVSLEFIGTKHGSLESELWHVIVLETVTVLNFTNGNVLISNVGTQ